MRVVMITDKKSPYYGMLGEVTGKSKMKSYYVNIKGYNNCIKAGYTKGYIKKANLAENGFFITVNETDCKFLSDSEIQELVLKSDAVKDTTPIDEIKELVSKLAVLPEDIDLLILAGEYADRINELLDLIQN